MDNQYKQLQSLLKQAAGVDDVESDEPDPTAIAMKAVERVEQLERELRRKDLETAKLKLLPPELHEFADDIPTPEDPEELRKVIERFTKKMEKFITKSDAPKDPLQTQQKSPPIQPKTGNAEVDAKTSLEKWMSAVQKGDNDAAAKWSARYLELTSQNVPPKWGNEAF